MKFAGPAIAFLLGALPLTAATVVFWEELPYFRAEDSPFFEAIEAGTIFLEDFEDQELNTPNIVSWDWPRTLQIGRTKRSSGNQFAESVDADDGLNGDFSGLNGDAWTTSSASTGGILGSMEFRFTPDVLGRYPTFVGFVVTEAFNPFDDVEFGTSTLTGPESPEVGYDPLDWIPILDTFPGDTRRHRFFGIHVDSGITRLNIDNVAQIDHLQYGYAIPEPSVAGMCAATLALACLRRRRRAIAPPASS